MNELEIQNFKSIKYLKQPCTRVNVFIGEPNTGKSNILEALGLLSYSQFSDYAQLNDFVRYTRTTNLFYDDFIDSPFIIMLGGLSAGVEFKNGAFSGGAHNGDRLISIFAGDYSGLRVAPQSQAFREKPLVKFYKFAVMDKFPSPESEYLLPPDGKNLVSLLLSNRELRSTVNDIFNHYGLKLVLKPHENSLEIIKQMEDIIISYPYVLVSDTLQRVVFHLSAVLTSKDSILVFEEPESHAFPYYTRYLAEIMALDEGGNQYFIATHNPYFLEPIVEKTPRDEMSVFVTYFEDYQTKVRPLSQDEIADLMHTDFFIDSDKFLKLL
ncbi:MAG: AAA family ATPase [Chloroflexi bacterium]|nr:AAA family ATPase [Chloroflexota bacterium]